MSKTIGWDRRLSVSGDGRGLVGHAGAVLLRKCADKTGLTCALSAVMPSSRAVDWWDRGVTLVGTAVAIVLGAACMSDVERLWAAQAAVFGAPASDSTIGRTLAMADGDVLARVAKARARIRRHVWSLLHLRPGGFPWLVVAGKRLTGWIVIDLDATLITAHSVKDGAAVTFKKTWGFHPLAAWCANTTESLAMLLRSGNAGSNTVFDHITVLTAALAQIPGACAAKILVRIDGAGATHDLLEHLESLNTSRRHLKMLTPFERKTGWRYQIIATNIGHMWGIGGSHHPQWLDVLHRAHAGVEDRVRTNKAMGLRNLPSKSWTVNSGWMLACNLAADLDAWTRLLGLHDSEDLKDAEPDILRYRLWHLPAKLTSHARRRWLNISCDWPWTKTFLTCWDRLTALPTAPA